MHVNDFKAILKRLNKNKDDELIFTRPLSDKVDLATFWRRSKDSKNNIHYWGPDPYYLIKNEAGNYIGLVEDANEFDLHWYILPSFRNKGYLSSALRSVILPHLFQDNRIEQRITIDRETIGEKNYLSSKALAIALGFEYKCKKKGVETYSLASEKYQDRNYIDGHLSRLTDIRAEELRKRIKAHAKELHIIQTELEMKLGQQDELLDIKEQLGTLARNFEGILDAAYQEESIHLTDY